MPDLPPPLAPDAGEQGFATERRASLRASVTRSWELLADYAESCDLDAPTRAKGRTGRDVLVPVGRWKGSRGLTEILDDARAGRVHRIDQEAYERRLRAAHSGAAPGEIVAAVRAAGREVAAWLGTADDDREGLLQTASPLGPLPVRTFLHAAVYQLAVVALDLETVSSQAAPGELLTSGLVALVDSTGSLAARRRLRVSLSADTRGGTATEDSGIWGFGSAGGSWVVAQLEAPVGPTVTASTRTILDITAGRTANVPGLVASGALRLHDIPGLLHLAPLVDDVPGIPGAPALRAATTTLGAAAGVLRRLRPPFGSTSP